MVYRTDAQTITAFCKDFSNIFIRASNATSNFIYDFTGIFWGEKMKLHIVSNI